jgi:hypothetical protein
MSPIWRIVKSFLLWSHGRTTWQYDVLCALILAFVFLTPKSWFDEGEPSGRTLHQKGSMAAEKLLIWPNNLRPNPDAQKFERRASMVTGRQGARVARVHKARDTGGRVGAYEFDIE